MAPDFKPPKRNGWFIFGCSKPDCKGTCPLQVIVRGYAKDGVKAKCQKCDRVFPLPKNSKALMEEQQARVKPEASAVRTKGRNQPTADTKLRADYNKLQKRLEALEASTAPTSEAGSASMQDESKAIAKRLGEPRWRDCVCPLGRRFSSSTPPQH